MNDAFRVRSLEAVEDLGGNVEETVERERALFDLFAEGEAVEKLHGDKNMVVVVVDLINGANIGVVEGGSGAGFTEEAIAHLGIVSNFGRKEFESGETLEAGVFGFIDDAHAALSDALEDAVVGDELTDELIGRRRH